jgi:D-threo-aldose 1-dehydrogenase
MGRCAAAVADVWPAHGTPRPADAIGLPPMQPSIINVALGMRTPGQVGQNVQLHDQQISVGLWGDLRTQGLTRPDVPVEHGGGRDESCL